MGADGHLQLLRQSDWPFEDVRPEEIGLREKVVLGVPALIAYHDTSGIDDMDDTWISLGFTKAREVTRLQGHLRLIAEKGENGRYQSDFGKKQGYAPLIAADLQPKLDVLLADPNLPHSQRCDEAANYFQSRAESITVWT